MVAFLVWIYFPIYFMISSSFKDNGAIFAYPPSIFFKPSLQGFISALVIRASGMSMRNWGLTFFNSGFVSAAGTSIAVLLGLPVAFALSQLPFKNKNTTAFGFLTIRMIPPVATLLPIYIEMSYLNLLGTYPALILVYGVFGLPWIIWLMWSFLGAIPHEIFEAAQIDGASNWRILFTILIPLAKAGLVVSIVFAFLEAYNDFVVSFILSSPATATIPVVLGTMLGMRMTLWNSIFAVGVLNLIPTIIIMVIVRNYWGRALSLGLVH